MRTVESDRLSVEDYLQTNETHPLVAEALREMDWRMIVPGDELLTAQVHRWAQLVESLMDRRGMLIRAARKHLLLLGKHRRL